jgi:primosomal protein N' (replication factor Y)
MPFYIDVIVPIALEQRFTYSITQQESEHLKVGMRVAVPFGKRKVYTAIVAKIHENPPVRYEAKPIEEILENTPTVTPEQLKLGNG